MEPSELRRPACLRRSLLKINNLILSLKVSGREFTKLSVTISTHQESSSKLMRQSRRPTSIAPFQTKKSLCLKRPMTWSFILSLWSVWITKPVSLRPARQLSLPLSLDSVTKSEKTPSQISRRSWKYAISLGTMIWLTSMLGFRTKKSESLLCGNTKLRRSLSRKERKRLRTNWRGNKRQRRRKNKR